MKTALVTGSRGFVGRHLRRRLEADSWFVVGIDLHDGHDCRDLFNTCHTRFDLVAHCAAVVGGRQTISGNPLAVAVDLELDAAMFRWAVRTRQHRIVYFSSSAAYPTLLQEQHGRRLKETDLDVRAPNIGAPDMSYGWAKVTGELLATYAEAEGVAVHVLRPFSGYGADQDDAYPFPAYIERAIRHAPTFDVWGDGTQTRDFIHIDDVVEAVGAVVDQDYRLPLNLGTGRPICFTDLARLVCQPLGYKPVIEVDLLKPTGPSYRVADVTRMAKVYQPRVTLEEGILRALTMKAAA